MKEKWDKCSEPRISDGHPIPKKWLVTEPMYKPKLLTHSPSLRAIRNYNDLPIDRNSGGIDNGGFESEYKYEYYVNPDYSISNGKDSGLPEYDYPTMSTTSMKTMHSSGGSEITSNSEPNEMGSSVKLVTAKVEMSCQAWCSHIPTIVCTISMAAGLGNLYRLPQMTLIRGGLPFLVVYAVLTVIIGIPLLFLELGIGQMAEEGFIKSWRAVPFFKGIGYVKLLIGCLLSVYYPLYMGMAMLYIIWILKGPVPFSECANGVIMTEEGYSPSAKNGQNCIRNTFIGSPFDDPSYFGIYAALLLFIWIIITMLSIRRTKSYVRSLMILFFPTMICYIALTTKTIILETEVTVLYKFCKNVDWNVLSSAEVWYYATIQVFFSTNVGFGSFVTNAGIMYNKVNPLWTALGYITTNLIFGTGSVIIYSILTGNINETYPATGDVAEVQLFALVYDAMRRSSDDLRYWMIATFGIIFFAGFISMATLSYTLLKAVYGHDAIRLRWWQLSLVLSFSGFVLSCALLLRQDFDLVHLLDHYIVGNLILISVVIEVLALIAFYGTGRIQSDFEFMLGHILYKTWLILWWFIPVLLTVIFAWGLAALPLEGIYKEDPTWLYATGWAVVLIAFIFIFVIGGFSVSKQDGYTIIDKLKASLEPSHNWGPKDPMLRHNWVQWNTKSKSGERDFTLKRRGTKDYTRTIKKKAKKEASELSAMSLPGAYFKSDAGAITNLNNNVVKANRLSNASSQNYSDLYYVSSEVRKSIIEQATSPSLADSLEQAKKHRRHHHHHVTNRHTFPVDNNQAALPDVTINTRHSFPVAAPLDLKDEASDGYGTFRKGPYIIDGDLGHVCHRRYSGEHEAVTEL